MWDFLGSLWMALGLSAFSQRGTARTDPSSSRLPSSLFRRAMPDKMPDAVARPTLAFRLGTDFSVFMFNMWNRKTCCLMTVNKYLSAIYASQGI